MISVQEATDIILQHSLELPAEEVPLTEAIGRVLREDLFADRPFPPYDRVTMDGIAIQYASFANGQRDFPIEKVIAAGDPEDVLENPAHCVEIMTGAVLPKGADIVIRYEDLEIEAGVAKVMTEAIKSSQNVHWKGSDRTQGSKIVEAGQLISPAEVGVAATIGKAKLKVTRLPKTAIISTGDELVDVSETPLPHQIRRSNVYRLQASLKQYKIEVDAYHLIDDQASIEQAIEQMLGTYDILLLSGGVSKGKFDFVPAAMEALGVKKLFHRIKQRPGKPFWFGSAPTGALVFALPGNPVSSFMCTQRYFVPWLRNSLGLDTLNLPIASLEQPVTFKPDLTYLCQVATRFDTDGRLLAKPAEGHGSGDLANLVEADAFIELPRGRDVFEAGECFPVYFYRF